MIILGVDPGQAGAICAISDESKDKPYFYDMPVMERMLSNKKVRKFVDIHEVRDILESFTTDSNIHVVIEEIVGMGPTLGHTAGAFSFASYYGALKGLLVALRLPHTLVHPQKWQKALGKTGGKEGSIIRARQLFPNADLVKPGCRKPSDGRAESLLLALFGLKFVVGN